MKAKGNKKNRIIKWILRVLLCMISIACLALIAFLSKELRSQQQAERWQGESEQVFSQISVFIPVHEGMDLNQVQQFRNDAAEKLKAAAFELNSDSQLYVDAWSSTGLVDVSSALGSGKAEVLAVGGDFFSFHPIRLLSGNYINPNDLMKDRVLLDEELAWLLFGGIDLQGLSFKINGQNFVVAGVVDRQADRESGLAYGGGMGLFMSYDAYLGLNENAKINCYEFVMAQPVEGFAYNFAAEKFKDSKWLVLENTGRFQLEELLDIIPQFGKRSMQTMGLIYPYWENAARYIEDWCALLLFVAIAAAVYPLMGFMLWFIRLFRKGKHKIEDDVLPRVKENTQEAIRVRQRRRWERKRGLHEKR